MYTKKKLIKSELNLVNLSFKLHKLCEFLNEVYDINSGGCCFIAGVLAELLEKDDVDFSVCVYSCDYDDFYHINCGQFHYCVRINYDDIKIYSKDDFLINHYEDDYDFKEFSNVNSEDLYQHYKECSWNNLYSKYRNKYIKKVITTFYNDFTHDLREK